MKCSLVQTPLITQPTCQVSKPPSSSRILPHGENPVSNECNFTQGIFNTEGYIQCKTGFPGGSVCEECTCNARVTGLIPGMERSPGGGHDKPTPVFLAWRIPWTEDHGGLQSTGSQRVGHDCATSLSLSRYLLTSYFCIPVPYNEKDIFFGC